MKHFRELSTGVNSTLRTDTHGAEARKMFFDSSSLTKKNNPMKMNAEEHKAVMELSVEDQESMFFTSQVSYRPQGKSQANCLILCKRCSDINGKH